MSSGRILALAVLAVQALAQDFTIINGQILTPGFLVLNAPQPDTPLGGGKSCRLALYRLPETYS